MCLQQEEEENELCTIRRNILQFDMICAARREEEKGDEKVIKGADETWLY